MSQAGRLEELRGQRVELFGRADALSNSVVHLAFTQHVHQFNADEGLLCHLKGLQPERRTCHPLHSAMVLLHHSIYMANPVVLFFETLVEYACTICVGLRMVHTWQMGASCSSKMSIGHLSR